jgi:hypothetical protein
LGRSVAIASGNDFFLDFETDIMVVRSKGLPSSVPLFMVWLSTSSGKMSLRVGLAWKEPRICS